MEDNDAIPITTITLKADTPSSGNNQPSSTFDRQSALGDQLNQDDLNLVDEEVKIDLKADLKASKNDLRSSFRKLGDARKSMD